MGHNGYGDNDRCPGCGNTDEKHPPSETCEFGKPSWRPVLEARKHFEGGVFMGYEIRAWSTERLGQKRHSVIMGLNDTVVLRLRIFDGELMSGEEADARARARLQQAQRDCAAHMRTPNGVCIYCNDGGD